MSQLQRRKRAESNSNSSGALADADHLVLNIIKQKAEMAISARDIKRETKQPENIFKKCIKNLQALGLIKEVTHIQFKGQKHYIAAEFEPSKEVTGGSWYVDGNLDRNFINTLRELSLKIVGKLKVTTAEGVFDFFKKNKITNVECTSQQIGEILKSMVLDNEIIEVTSSGLGEYHSIPIGAKCYRCLPKGLDKGLKIGVMASIPCGVCPRISQCTPEGIISPSTCVYYTKWLEPLDF